MADFNKEFYKKYRRIVVAVDKFKGTLTAEEAAEAISQGVLNVLPDAEVILCPMADGGEGSLSVVQRVIGGERVTLLASDPLGRRIPTQYLLKDNHAFIEMAQISGLTLVKPIERNIFKASTYGLGEVIHHAVEERGVRKVSIAIGGSATNDGGLGMLQALGFSYLEESGVFDSSQVDKVTPHLSNVSIEVACDVENPLLGANGATFIYAKQKGATKEQLPILEGRMNRFAKGVAKWKGVSFESITTFKGGGAAGGVGFALHEVLGGELIKGWELFSNMLSLEEKIASADLVITGEGKFDTQSLEGKLPVGVAQLCLKHRKPLWLLCGRNMVREATYRCYGICRVVDLYTLFERNSPEIMKNAAQRLTQAASYIFSK